MVASISTWRRDDVITRSMNSWTFSCWRDVARTVTTPLSGFMMTEAASRKVLRRTTELPVAWLEEPGAGLVCRALAMACAARCPPPCGRAAAPVEVCELACSMTVSLDPSGKILSVSCRMSLMFFSSCSQNMFRELFWIEVFETLLEPLATGEAPAPLAPPGWFVLIWVLVDTVPVTVRAMFT